MIAALSVARWPLGGDSRGGSGAAPPAAVQTPQGPWCPPGAGGAGRTGPAQKRGVEAHLNPNYLPYSQPAIQ